jgi:hypothetical protein
MKSACAQMIHNLYVTQTKHGLLCYWQESFEPCKYMCATEIEPMIIFVQQRKLACTRLIRQKIPTHAKMEEFV